MQEEILNLLLKSKKPLSRTEIAIKLNARPEKVTNRLTPLVKTGEVLCIEIDRKDALILYGSKRTLRLYYCKGS